MGGRHAEVPPRRTGTRVLLSVACVLVTLAAVAFLAGPLLRRDGPDPAALQARISDAQALPPGAPDRLPGAVGPADPGGTIGDALDALGDATRPRPVPAPDPAPAPRPEPGPAAQVVGLINDRRADAGCPALTVDRRITAAAQGHSDDMAAQDYFEHDSPDGRSFDQRIAAAGYPDPGAENIARGQPDAATVVQEWMDSTDHRRNILDCSLRTTGVGRSGEYWTQDFGY